MQILYFKVSAWNYIFETFFNLKRLMPCKTFHKELLKKKLKIKMFFILPNLVYAVSI